MAQTEEAYDHLYKIILVGDANVGKTHLLSRYIRGTLPRSPMATVGVEFATRTIPLPAGGTVKAQIWDTAGQEKYRSITSAHYRRAVGALLVYDVTRKSSFLNASRWLEELRQHAEPDIVVMLVGNKLDLVDQAPTAREVAYTASASFAQQHSLFFSEASAVSAQNVSHIFEHLMQEIYNQKSKARMCTENVMSNNTNFTVCHQWASSENNGGGGLQLAPSAPRSEGFMAGGGPKSLKDAHDQSSSNVSCCGL